MPTPAEPLVRQVRKLLDLLVSSRRLSNDDQEEVGDQVVKEVKELPRANLLDVLDKAIGTSKKRREESIYILVELTDIPEAVERIGQHLNDADEKWRSQLIQTVGDKRLRQFAPLLNNLIENDPDPFCRDMAIHAAGELAESVNLPTLIRLAERNDPTMIWRIAVALKSYANEQCRPHLKRWFDDYLQEKETRVISAWGLGKLGDQQAIEYLTAMLHDPDIETPNGYFPGESLRAAQALCDIMGWDFEWHKSYVDKTICMAENDGLNSHGVPLHTDNGPSGHEII